MRARRQTGQGGFTIVEVMVAVVLLGVALIGLAQLSGAQMIASLRNRVRQVAISYVNQELESIRSMTYTRLANDPSDSTSPPATETVGGTVLTRVDGSSGCTSTSTCLTYQKSVTLTDNQVTGASYTFTEDRWVGEASAGASYKTVVVTLTATSGPSFTYSASTDVSGATTNNPTAVTALQIDLEQVDTSGNVVTDPTTGNAEVPPNGFTVTVSSGGTTVATGSSADGSYGVTSGLSANTTYSCTVTNPGGGSLATWAAYTSGDSSFSCATGAAGTTTSYTSRWYQKGCTYDSTAGTGALTATVYNTSGAVVSGVTVALTHKQGQTNPANVNTNTSGVAQFGAVETGLFVVKISGGGLQGTQNDLASVCIWPGATSQITIFGSGPAPGGSGNVNLIVPVENTYPGGTATLAVEAADTTDNYKFETQVDVDGCGTSCTATNVTVPVYKNFTYVVTINCVGVGGANPPGSTDGATVQDGQTLATWSPAKITANTTDPTTEAIKCPQS